MITHSGKSIYPRGSENHDPTAVPTLDDIARGLGRIVRFAGQTEKYYTVLCHTLTVAEITTPEARIYALLHDAPESVVSDVPATWKTNAAVVRENELMQIICNDNDVVWPPPKDLWEKVMKSDAAALAAEAHILGHSKAQEFWPIEKFTTIEHIALHQTYINQNKAFEFMDSDKSSSAYRNAIEDAKQVMREDARLSQSTNP